MEVLLKKGMSANALKLFALCVMTLDHIGMLFFPNVRILRIIGRLAFPVFAYFIAEGCRYTRHPLRYFLLVFGVGALCSIVYWVVERNLYQCILITFSLSIAVIYAIKLMRQGFTGGKMATMVLGILICLAAFVIAYQLSYPSAYHYGLGLDYGLFGVFTPVLVFLVPSRLGKLAALALGLVLVAAEYGGIQWYALFALVPLFFYRGERGRWNLKYLFYVYYPLHLAALYGISLLV